MPANPRQPALLEKVDGPLLRALMSIPAAIWIADRVGLVIWMNVAGTTLLGDRTGSHFTRFVVSEDAADAREMFARTVHGHPDPTTLRLRMHATAETLATEVTFLAIRDVDDVMGVIALLQHEEPADNMLPTAPEPRLTPRQHQVLRLLAECHSTNVMARELQISEQTVRNHVRFLLAELRVRSRLEAVVVASRNNWL